MNSIDKRVFISKVSKKLKRKIKISHINSVINILCDLLLSSLKDENKLAISNFGIFFFQKAKPRKHFDVLERKIKYSKGNHLIKFKLNKKLKKKILEHLE